MTHAQEELRAGEGGSPDSRGANPVTDTYPVFAHWKSKMVKTHRYGFVAPMFFTDTKAKFPRGEKVKSIVMMLLAMGIFIEYVVLLVALIAYDFHYDKVSMVVIIVCYVMTLFPLTYYVARTMSPGIANLFFTTTKQRRLSANDYLTGEDSSSASFKDAGIVVCAMPFPGQTKKEREVVASKMELAALTASMNKEGISRYSKISKLITILGHYYEAQSNVSSRDVTNKEEWELKERHAYKDFFDEMVEGSTAEIDAAFVEATVSKRKK